MERERVWMASIMGDTVTVRHYAVLTHGEELTDDPPTQVMRLADWQDRHAEFGCHLDGTPVNPRPGVGMPTSPDVEVVSSDG